MRYVTGLAGAAVIFFGVMVVSLLIHSFAPPVLQRRITIPLGSFEIWGSPALLCGLALGFIAAVHSFRSTLKRYESKPPERQHSPD